MKIGTLVKHITQDKWGLVLDILQTTEWEESGLDADWVEVLWSDEAHPSWVWDDLLKVIS